MTNTNNLPVPRGMFELACFNKSKTLFCVVLINHDRRVTRYFHNRIQLRDQALFSFWRKLGAA